MRRPHPIIDRLYANLKFIRREKWAKRQVCRDALGRFAVWTLSVLILLTLAGCRHNIHPGAISAADSTIYDTLLVAQGALDEGRKTIASSNIAQQKEYSGLFNKAAALYNQAEADWQIYHSTGDPAFLSKLQTETAQVVSSISDLQKAFGKKVGP